MESSLHRLLNPRSIAILGASADVRKVSGRPLKHLLDKGYPGKIYPVNPKYAAIGELHCYPQVSAIPGSIDLAIIVLPASEVIEALSQLGEKCVPAAVVFSSGFAEMGERGRALEAQLKQAATRAGIRLCGPNCLGFINAFDKVTATFSQYADGPVPAGPVGFVTQSGAFGTAIAALARNRGLGLGYFINTGNEADIDFVQIMKAVIADPRISVGAGYIEGMKNGPGFLELADRAMAQGKPLVVTKVGRMGAGARAAASHTGALAGDDVVFSGIARQAGVIRARNEEHMLDMVEVFSCCALPEGQRIGLLTQSGGAGVLMADRAEELGLEVPLLHLTTQQALHEVIPGFGAVGNPVDITGQFVAEPDLLRKSTALVLADPNIDIGVIWFQLMHAHVDKLVRVFEDIKENAKKPFVVCWVAAPEAGIKALRERGIAVLRGAEPAIDAVAGLCQYANARGRWLSNAGTRPSVHTIDHLPSSSGIVPTLDAARLLASSGLCLATPVLADSAERAVHAAEKLGYPVAVKIESPDIPHKTDAGGVVLNVKDAEGMRCAYTLATENSRRRHPDARIEGVVVQKMASGDTEFVIGLQNDPVFGVVIMVGLGGVLIEVLKDVAFRKVPLSETEAEDMLSDLRGKAILRGVRGRAPVNRKALLGMICAASQLGAALGPRLDTLDINPVLLGPNSVIAVDWLMVLNEGSTTA